MPWGVAAAGARPPRREIYARLDAAIAELRDRLGGLPSPVEARAIWDDIWVHEAHNSTAIEGNTLVLRQVEQLLREGRAVGNKQLAEYLEVQGYAEAARWVYSQALEPGHEAPHALLTLTELRHVHRLAINPVWEVAPHPDATSAESPGNFRQHDIRPFPSGMTPPSHALVPARLQDWLDEGAPLDTPGDQHLIERLAAVHASFGQVHPFLDGNGRAGRVLLNLLLARLGYPPAIIQKRSAGATSRRCALPTPTTTARWPNCSPELCWTTSTDSSSRRSPVPSAWCPRRPGHPRGQRRGPTKRRPTGPAASAARPGRSVAQQPGVGGGLPLPAPPAESDVTRKWRHSTRVSTMPFKKPAR